MKLAIYTTMPLSNNYIGVHGITMFMFPLIKELKRHGHIIKFCGYKAQNEKSNIFCDILKLKPYVMDISKDVINTSYVDDCDALLVYNRPTQEYIDQNRMINRFVLMKKPIFYWMGDDWKLPITLSQHCVLLRPFSNTQHDKLFKYAYRYDYFVHNLYNYVFEKREKIIDLVYIGNYYNRFDVFEKKFKHAHGNVVVAGSWLRDKERWNNSLKLKNILYIGEIPHCYALPLLAISKKTKYIIPTYYKDLGMKTSRIYEAAMAGCETDVSIKNLNTVEEAYYKLIALIQRY